MAKTPTAEQDRARELFGTGAPLVIEAGAGTGKTSTLTYLARSTKLRGHYIAFNKSIVVEAQGKMPANVTCSTAHSLAYQAVGKTFGHRLRTSQRMRSADVARMLDIDPIVVTTKFGTKRLAPGYLAGLANRTITRFCQTADPTPNETHVPYIDGIDLPTEDGRRTYVNNNAVAREIADVLPRMWADLSNPNGHLTYRHEHYLKLWQLTKPIIHADFILFDEAQDANPVMQAIVLAQEGTQVVWVGDSQQQIYGWNGAVNAMSRVEGAERTFLSQSFRFGPEIAAVANSILERLDADLELKGSPNVSSVVREIPSPDVILTRTNAGAFSRLFARQDMDERPHVIGGGAEVVSFAKAAAELQMGRKCYHPELACFDSWTEVQEYVQTDEQGSELKMLANLVDNHGTAKILRALERMPREDYADVVISTAHKAKGREWGSVQLAGDFPAPKEGEEEVADEELRLLYVAVTRAQHELDVSAVASLS